MENLTFHHIGIATKKIDKSIKVYQSLGYELQDDKIVNDPIQNVMIAFMYRLGHPLIEIVAPVDETSPVFNILKKMKTTPYHTCYEVVDIEEAINNLKIKKFVVVQQPVKAIAFDNRLVSFLYHRDMGLVELLQNY
jgi:methylmalonyl-CoA/ethylmalonyl-CoA epimerase